MSAVQLDWNLVLNVFTLAAMFVVAVPVLRSKRKDAIITEQGLVIESHERRIKALEGDLEGARDRADTAAEQAKQCETRAAEWQARYEEQAKYTAEPAVEAVMALLRQHIEAVQERHERMIATLDRLVDSAGPAD